jgi:hypothetical protein
MIHSRPRVENSSRLPGLPDQVNLAILGMEESGKAIAIL